MLRYCYLALLVGALSLAIPGSSFAQPATSCADALRFAGVSWETKTADQKIDSAVNQFCSKRFESSQDAQSALTKAGFVIDAIPMSFGGDFSNQQFQQKQEEFCSNDARFSLARSQGASVVKLLDENVTKAVGDCIRQQSTGLFAWIEKAASPEIFKVRLALRGVTSPAKIKDFTVLPSTVKCTSSLNGSFKLNLETVCTRDPVQAVAVTLNSPNYSVTWVGEASLPADVKWVQHVCVGTLYLQQPYTTEADGRISKSLSCPNGMIVIPDSGKCLRTSNNVGGVKKSEKVGDSTWVCEWEQPQPVGVGLWVELGCKCR